MNYSLPFYGKKGTISTIKENNNNYIVNCYDFTGKDNIVLEVPKNNRNYNQLIDNYYKDLKEYLKANNNKYEYYNQTKKENKTNKKTITLLKLISIAAIALSIPLLSTHEELGYIGITLNAISIPLLVSSINLTTKARKEEKKKKFINKYNELEHRLRIYNENKVKSYDQTKYMGVKSYEKEPKRDLNKILEKKKVS